MQADVMSQILEIKNRAIVNVTDKKVHDVAYILCLRCHEKGNSAAIFLPSFYKDDTLFG